jgi:signal transduction histidine kinase
MMKRYLPRSFLKDPMALAVDHDIQAVQSLTAVPTIMQVIAQTTGLRWICVSRVTQDAWTMCAVRDELDFGLAPGDEIAIADTFCDQVRRTDTGVIIDAVSNDALYHDHPIPKKFGFESYFSIPIYRKDGEFFGTLCGLDPRAASLRADSTLNTLKLFAELLSSQIEAETVLAETRAALAQERDIAELREQFIAILGHDLRTPLSSIMTGAQVIDRLTTDERILRVSARMTRSGQRIASLIDSVMDFTRSKMDGALAADRRWESDLHGTLSHVVAELAGAYPGRAIEVKLGVDGAVFCDLRRVGQVASNLIVNALVHGSADAPVSVAASTSAGALCLTVSNAGTPIAPSVLERLFQPFWRGERSSKVDGLGLGLYIASEIARAHEGSLTVDSTPARTVFTLTIPRGTAPVQ